MTTYTPSLAQDLIRIHKVITRGLEVGLVKGKEYINSGVSEHQELPGYSNYIHCYVNVISSHHQAEDLIIFPEFHKVLPLAPYTQLAADHRWIEKILPSIPPAIEKLSYDAREEGLKTIIDSLSKINEIWGPHISMEEHFFSKEVLNGVMEIEEQLRISTEVNKYSQEHTSPPYWIIPFVLFNLEPDDREIMSSMMPAEIVNEMVPVTWKDQWTPMKPFLIL